MIKFSVIYNFKKKLLKDGTALIQIRAYSKGKRRYFSTGIYVTPFQWSEKLNQVIDHPNTFQYNSEIRRQINGLEAFAYGIIQKQGAISLQQLDAFFKYSDTESFTAFWQYEYKHDTMLAKETKKKHKTALNYWIQFRKDVKFHELDFNLIHQFDQFLYDKNLHINTVYTHHKQVRKYINLAIKKAIFDANKNPYLHFKPKTVPTERVVLTQEEVLQLEQLTFTKENQFLALIRDMFLFACYTGVRFADLRAIRYRDIEKDQKGFVLNIIAEKTGKQLLLPLYKLHNAKPQQILQQYIIPGAYPHTTIFHKYANQYYNRSLKKIAALANINKSITSHVARHTFATHLASKVPIHILKSILQHSKIETTMIYVHLSNKIVNDALDRVDW
jgi:integrase